MPSASMASLTSRQIPIVSREICIRSSSSGQPPPADWWLMTPRKLTPGSPCASFASTTPCSGLRTPPLPICVSTSIRTPIWTPFSAATSEIVSMFSALSTVTLTSPCLFREASLASLSLVTIWLGISTSVMPPSTITSASESLAVHTPLSVPPACICMLARRGLLMFLVC